jgi:opacity protein-like surface antigen
MRTWNRALTSAALACACLTGSPADADLSAFVAAVGFDDEANLDGAPGFGLRWGKSSGLLGGETSLMIARPDREVATFGGTASEAATATAIFYEGRILLNIPLGEIKPFVGVGFGRIMILPGDLTKGAGADDKATLKALSDTETNSAFSYGGGVRYALNDRIDGRFDVRLYQVFSVTGALTDAAIDQIVDEAGVGELVPQQTEENTVTYSELSVGIVFRF